jgi:hypothetical protein
MHCSPNELPTITNILNGCMGSKAKRGQRRVE